MSVRSIIGIVIVVLLIMFLPVLLADGIERFVNGLVIVFGRWT